MFRNACLKMFLCCLMMVCMQHAFAQKIVTGKVTDAKGNAVQNASVLIKGNKTGTTTDATGAFKINVPASVNTIVVSYVGFATQEINVADNTNVEVVLTQQANNLNDVVVVGYGTTKKKDLTGAVTN